MLTVLGALVPVFLLVITGNGLKRTLLPSTDIWIGMERLNYYILFPALLIDQLARADLKSVPVAGVGGALLIAVLMVTALCFALRPSLRSLFATDGPAFTSIFQGATRWQTFVAITLAANLYGDAGVALASVAMVAMISLLNILCVWVLAHYAAPRRLSPLAMVGTIAKNPLIWSCILGIVINVSGLIVPQPIHAFAASLGQSSIVIGLLAVGAGLHFEGLGASRGAVTVATLLKLVVMPAVAISLALAFGVRGENLAVVACCASVPTASNGYILARQMGGDAPLMAQIIAVQTILAALTMPVAITLAAGF